MKSFFRNAALAVAVLSLGAAVRPVSAKLMPAKNQSAIPVPACPTNSPDGCGIYS